MVTKICSKCATEKALTEFSARSDSPDGLQGMCRCCRHQNNMIWRGDNVDKVRVSHKKAKANYRKNHPDRYVAQWKAVNQKRKESGKKNQYLRDRRKEDLNFKLLDNLRRRLRESVDGGRKTNRTMSLLGCSIDHFKAWLEFWMKPGMTWENYGYYGWHIDHKRPCASFDMTDPEQQRQCFHYTNLEPLWAKDNLQKGDKVNATR